MPPKFKFTRDQIIQAALEIARREGLNAVTARAVGAKLRSSSKVIFSLFRDMEELQQEVKAAAYRRYQDFLREDIESGNYPPYKAAGMGYIRFSSEEKELFKMLFLCDRKGEEEIYGEEWESSVEMIMKANGTTREQAELLHLEMWICVHGIATMLATSYLTLKWDLISQILTDFYLGVRARVLSAGGIKDEGN